MAALTDKMACFAALVALLPAAALVTLMPASAAAQEVRSGGNGTIYMGAYNQAVYVIDEATLEVRERIPVTTGIPNRFEFSPDNETLYIRDAALEHIEVVDLTEGRSVDSFTLSEANTRVRIRSMAVDPGEEYILLAVRSYTKLLDRFEISDFTLVRVDLDTHEVTDTIPLPYAEQRQGINLRFSPDGELLYFFGRDIIAVETENFTEVDRWELSRPLEEGLGRINLSFQPSPYDEAGHLHQPLPHDGPRSGPADDGHRAGESGGAGGRLLHPRAQRIGQLCAGAGRAQGVRAPLRDRPLRVLDL